MRALPLRHLAWAGALWLAAARSFALELTATRAKSVRYGAPDGPAVSRNGDPQRLHRAQALPPLSARVLWQALVAGGISGNLLVDARERLILASGGQISQFASDGTPELELPASFSEALELALLSDETRAVLSREGHVLGFAASGEVRFDVELDGSTLWSEGHLIGVASGGAAAALGAWLYHLDASGVLQSRVRWNARLTQLLPAGNGVLALDEKGQVLEWDGYGEPRPRGGFGARAVASLLPATRELLAVVSGQTLVRLAIGSSAPISQLSDTAGLLPALAVPDAEHILLFRSDGARVVLGRGDAANSMATRTGSGRLEALDAVAGRDGSRAWWAAHVPLALETPNGDELRELAAVRCPDPLSLVSLGPFKLAAACRGGQLWVIGP